MTRSKTSPNLILITTDQQRFDTIRYGGASHMLTPHLDWLMETGIHYRRGYTESPVCVSSRASMLTGQHFHRMQGCGWWNQPTTHRPTETLPALLTQAGYQTHGYGKFHYHPPRCNYGWEHMEPLEIYYREMAERGRSARPMDHGLGQNEMEPAIGTVHENDSLTRWTIDRGIRFLETRDEGRPFCLYLGFSKPHPPFDPPLNYWSLYEDAKLPDPIYGDWSANAHDIPGGLMRPTWALNGCDNWTVNSIRRARRAYYALITQVDYQLGLLLARLRELGQLDNTHIMFTSDHGEMLGDHHMGGKCLPLEASAHVPYIIRPTNDFASLRGTHSDQLACMADILPTFAHLAGIEVPESTDGIALLDESAAERERLFFLVGDIAGVLEGNHKYIWSAEGGGELLFDLKDDPHEQRNLIGLARYAGTHAQLKQNLAQEMETSGHSFASNGQLNSTSKAPTREQARVDAWPGFHSIAGTREDLLH